MGKGMRVGSRADGGDDDNDGGPPLPRLGADDAMLAQPLAPSLECRGITGQPVWLRLYVLGRSFEWR
jgi:hypothetical protein